VLFWQGGGDVLGDRGARGCGGGCPWAWGLAVWVGVEGLWLGLWGAGDKEE
jgi:hypothetical protein